MIAIFRQDIYDRGRNIYVENVMYKYGGCLFSTGVVITTYVKTYHRQYIDDGEQNGMNTV